MKNGRIKTFICVCAAAAMLLGSALNAFAATADITEDSVRIRSEASTSGEQVGTGKKGESYKIQETVTGSDGNTWYKVQTTDGKTGYIRGDLVKVKQESTDAGNGDANTATSLAPTETTSIDEAKAVVGGNSSVNIRSGAGTGYAKVASLPAGSELVLVGEADDSSGNKWYQFKCEAKGVEGFIRSDLITITEEPAAEEPAEGEGEGADMPMVEEEPQPVVETPVNNDYEIVYTEDEEGNPAYYLYDHVNNTRQKVNDLMSAVTTLNDKYQESKDEAENNKIIAIICGGLALIFAILMIVFIIKYSNAANNGMYDYDDDDDYDDRNARYDDSDDEEYEEDEEDEEDDEDEDDYDRRPQRRSSGNRRGQRSSASVSSRSTVSSRSGASSRTSSYGEAPRKPRKSQNFLVDDDEFEFEFLNMDDKD